MLLLTGNFLSSQGVATQVLSASECLTAVFGMGTGGTIQATSPDIEIVLSKLDRSSEPKLKFRVSRFVRVSEFPYA